MLARHDESPQISNCAGHRLGRQQEFAASTWPEDLDHQALLLSEHGDGREIVTNIPVPSNAQFLSALERVLRSGRPRWRNATRDRLYEWDSLHGELEVYNNRGRHLGAVDPETGKFVKPPVKGWQIDV